MGCICSQNTKNSDLNTAPDPTSKPVSAVFEELNEDSKKSQIIKEDTKSENMEETPTLIKNDAKKTHLYKVTEENSQIDQFESIKSKAIKSEEEDNDDKIHQNDESVNNTSKIKKKKKKFDIEIIELINNFRQNPKDFIEKLKSMIPLIKTLSNDKLVYHKKGQPRIVMNTGEQAILSTIDYISKLTPMNKLEVKKEIAITVPPNPDLWTSKYSSLVEEKTNELKKKSLTKYSILSFHFDLSISDPETSLLLQLVDDNSFKGLRRSHICDPEMKYIAVTYASVNTANSDISGSQLKKSKDKKFCSYFTFAK